MNLPRHRQRVDDRAQAGDIGRFQAGVAKLMVEETDIEIGVVNDQLGAGNEIDEFLDDLREPSARSPVAGS